MCEAGGCGCDSPVARDMAANHAADAHYAWLHRIAHNPAVSYRACEDCKRLGWR